MSSMMKLDGLVLTGPCTPQGRTPLAEAAISFAKTGDVVTLQALVADHPVYRDVVLVRQQLAEDNDDVVAAIVSPRSAELMEGCTNPVVVRWVLELEVLSGLSLAYDESGSEEVLSSLASMTAPGIDDLVDFLALRRVRFPLESDINPGGTSCPRPPVGRWSSPMWIEYLFFEGNFSAALHTEVVVACLAMGGSMARNYFLWQAIVAGWNPELFHQVRTSGPVLVTSYVWWRLMQVGTEDAIDALFSEYRTQISRAEGARMVCLDREREEPA